MPDGTRLGVLLVLTVLAGCAAPVAPPSEGAPRDAADPFAFLELSGCREHQGLFVAPSSSFAPLLPEGFVPAPFNDPALALWSAFTYECARAVGPTGDLGPMRDTVAILVVDPPPAFENESIRFHVFALAGEASNATAAFYRAWDWHQVEEAAVTYTEERGPASRAESAGAISLATTLVGEPADWEGRTLRIYGTDFPLGGGARPRVVSAVDILVDDRRVVSDGEARYALLPGHPLAAIVPERGAGVGELWVMEPERVAYRYARVALPGA